MTAPFLISFRWSAPYCQCLCSGSSLFCVCVCVSVCACVRACVCLSGFRSQFSPLFCFITIFLIMCVLLWCLTNEIEDHYADSTFFFCFASELKVRFRASKNWFKLHPTPNSVSADLLRCFVCWTSLFVRLWFHVGRLFYPYLFFISPSFSA